MDKKYILSLYIAIGLAALASIPLDPFKNKWLPIILCSTFMIFSIVLFIKYFSDRFSFKIIFNRDKALIQAKIIYEYAKSNGGELYSTHIYPSERFIKDLLTDTFNNLEKKLAFHRLIFIDDPVKLDQSIRSTFSINSELIDIEVLVPSSTAFVPNFIWYTIPRINITSYFDPSNNIAMTSIGLFRIYTKDNIRVEGIPISPTIHFYSKNKLLFNKIKEYFRAFNHGHFDHIHSIQEYKEFRDKILLQAKFKSFLSRLLFICDNSNLGILNVSLFGQYALYRTGVFNIGSLRIDYDIDLIVICEKGNKEIIMTSITKEANRLDFPIKIIWGPFNDDFYSIRTKEQVYVDIEIFEEGDDYYKDNALLGHSIIPSCVSIYMRNEATHRLFNLLVLPDQFGEIYERARIFLNTRKGLYDFRQSIKHYQGQYDPIRVISHVIRNIVWVLIGYFETSYEKAFSIIENKDIAIFDSDFMENFLSMQKDRNSIPLNEQQTITSDLINRTIECMEYFMKDRIV